MILFLDIDGVLNGHEQTESGYCTIEKDKVKNLNYVLNENPEIKIVISSAWRYLILTNQMNLSGFENMLLTYGLCVKDKIIDYLPEDNKKQDRKELILKYIQDKQLDNWIVIDDLLLDFPKEKFVKCDYKTGLDIQKRNELNLKIRGQWIKFTEEQLKSLKEANEKANKMISLWKKRTRIKPNYWDKY